ncbi:17973_t:CDS:2 [Racocetra persica]|uniref:17973_t:CDS:1 n=1 Tax=Racocetra persica TaxID=160502 RepID=A0ACA9N758_9GLOM|nr:17973_t:CDS:2 [Racocetra persica]
MVGSNIKKSDLDILKAQLYKYAYNEEPYNGSYVPDIDSPFLEDRYNNLETKNLESIVKISSYLISNTKQELHYYGLDLTKEEIKSIFQDFAVFSEVKEKSISDNLNNLNEIINSFKLKVEYQNLEIESLIVLNNFELDEEDKNSNEKLNENELDREELDHEELDHEEFDHEEFDESKFDAEFKSMLSGV